MNSRKYINDWAHGAITHIVQHFITGRVIKPNTKRQQHQITTEQVHITNKNNTIDKEPWTATAP
jgi:hypothetical protein